MLRETGRERQRRKRVNEKEREREEDTRRQVIQEGKTENRNRK